MACLISSRIKAFSNQAPANSSHLIFQLFLPFPLQKLSIMLPFMPCFCILCICNIPSHFRWENNLLHFCSGIIYSWKHSYPALPPVTFTKCFWIILSVTPTWKWSQWRKETFHRAAPAPAKWGVLKYMLKKWVQLFPKISHSPYCSLLPRLLDPRTLSSFGHKLLQRLFITPSQTLTPFTSLNLFLGLP